ncbi:hypothetical protein DRI50_05520, partial [candidate division KSB1 bacterium]
MKAVKQTIMLVDDSVDNLTLLSEILKPQYDILTATDGLKALQLLQTSKRPDLILLDIIMPGMDGFEVCRRLKDNHQTAEIPVIFITGLIEREQIIRGFETGA